MQNDAEDRIELDSKTSGLWLLVDESESEDAISKLVYDTAVFHPSNYWPSDLRLFDSISNCPGALPVGYPGWSNGFANIWLVCRLGFSSK